MEVMLQPMSRRIRALRVKNYLLWYDSPDNTDYYLGRTFIPRTDHSSLTWLLEFKVSQEQLARWLEDAEGRKHRHADLHSRMLVEVGACDAFRSIVNLKVLVCGDVTTAQGLKLGQFIQNVDEAELLVSQWLQGCIIICQC